MTKVSKRVPDNGIQRENLKNIFNQLEIILFYRHDILVDLSKALTCYYTSLLGEYEGTEGTKAIQRKKFSFDTLISLLDELGSIDIGFNFTCQFLEAQDENKKLLEYYKKGIENKVTSIASLKDQINTQKSIINSYKKNSKKVLELIQKEELKEVALIVETMAH